MNLFLTVVHHHVTLEKVVFAEAPGAVRTPVGPGPAVDKHVTFQISGSWKTLVTKPALVRFILKKSVFHIFHSTEIIEIDGNVKGRDDELVVFAQYIITGT